MIERPNRKIVKNNPKVILKKLIKLLIAKGIITKEEAKSL